MEIKKELIDELLKDYQRPEDVIGENGLLKQLTKALLERAMSAELTSHLAYEKSDPAGYNSAGYPFYRCTATSLMYLAATRIRRQAASC